jgi:hypothetical protein
MHNCSNNKREFRTLIQPDNPVFAAIFRRPGHKQLFTRRKLASIQASRHHGRIIRAHPTARCPEIHESHQPPFRQLKQFYHTPAALLRDVRHNKEHDSFLFSVQILFIINLLELQLHLQEILRENSLHTYHDQILARRYHPSCI